MPSGYFAESSRLLIRPIRLDDAEALFEYRSDPDANRFQGWIPQTIGDAYDFISTKTWPEINIRGTWFQFAVLLKESNKLIGDIGIHFLPSEEHEVELGCTFSKTHQGKGYATEALTLVVGVVFNELNKRQIFASIDPQNHPSIALFTRLGFSKQNSAEENKVARAEWPDDLVFVLRKEEWKNR